MQDAALNGGRFEVDADITVARTLDKSFYLDGAVFDLATERIFSRSWHWLGGLDDVADAGTLAPRVLLPGLLDEPLLLARDSVGTLRCLSNVCTHRGNVLVAEACRAAHIRCGYHGRQFDLDGRLRGMPGFEGARGFPTAADDLPVVGFGEFLGHGYAALQPVWPLDSWLGEVRRRLPWPDATPLVADPARSADYCFDAHWALYVENYLEGLHIPFVHPGLNETLALGGYRSELNRGSVLQLAPASPGQPAFSTPAGAADDSQRIAAYYWWLFPNLMLNFYPWGLSVNIVEPLGPARTRVLFRSFVADPALLDAGAGGALDRVEREDEAVVLGVQRGLRSRLYRGGRYAPRHESGVHHFHRLLCDFMRPCRSSRFLDPG